MGVKKKTTVKLNELFTVMKRGSIFRRAGWGRPTIARRNQSSKKAGCILHFISISKEQIPCAPVGSVTAKFYRDRSFKTVEKKTLNLAHEMGWEESLLSMIMHLHERIILLTSFFRPISQTAAPSTYLPVCDFLFFPVLKKMYAVHR